MTLAESAGETSSTERTSEIAKDSDTLQVTFPESMNFELHEYKRDPPMTVRIEKAGLDLIIKTPDEFFDWLGRRLPAIREKDSSHALVAF